MVAVAPVSVQPQQIKLLLEKNEEFFIHFFLGDELTKPVPEFHKDTFHLMTHSDISRLAIALPRDHAKTTLAKLAVVWYFLFSDISFIVYLSNTASVAQAACVDIMQFMENSNFTEIFGNIEYKIERGGEGFYKFVVTLDGKEKTCILKALGAGQQVRGLNIEHRRPQLAIVDDLEDPELLLDRKQYDKLKTWFMGTFRKALDKFGHKIIHIGNMISNMCLLKDHCESKYWYSVRYGCLLSNGEPLWPDAWPLPALKADFNEYLDEGKIDVWFAEMMNLPIAAGMGLIKAHEINYMPILYPEDIEYGFITVDPAISSKKWAHKAAVVVHGFHEGKWQICAYEARRGVKPLELFHMIAQMAVYWKVNVVGIESVAYQESLQYVFPYFAVTEGFKNLEFVPIYTLGVRKAQRLAGWAAMIKKEEYYITEGDFVITQQLLAYDPNKKENDDDEIDCCASGVQMIDRYMPLILSTIDVDPIPTGNVQNSYEVAEI